MWIHGEALIFGSRKNINTSQLQQFLAEGYMVVSIDYRLAPETKLSGIIEDVKDAYAWLLNDVNTLHQINPNRMAVIGHSAGGYLALMSGFHIYPRPKALVSFYGYSDITGIWYSKPSSFYLKQPIVTREEAYKSISANIISEMKEPIMFRSRWRFYLYCRQYGVWPKEVAGQDPKLEPEYFSSYCPIQNITKEYPPTFLLHGKKDTDVPYEQSLRMSNELTRVGVENELYSIPNGRHGFDQNMRAPIAVDAFQRVLDFLKKHIY